MRNNGKQTEAEIYRTFKDLEQRVHKFDFQRLYDATSARGAFQAQVGDFLWFMPKMHGVVEAKSTKHEYRLTKQAFGDKQIPRLIRRAKAGGEVWVIVHHWMTGVWRLVPLELVQEAFIDKGVSSVDLRADERASTFDTAEECVLDMINKVMEKQQ